MKKVFVSLFGLFVTASSAQTYMESVQVVNVQPKFVTTYQRHCTQTQLSPSDNSGVGTVLGGIAGGIIGNQVGRGDGNTAATVAGAVIGGMVGNRIGQDQINQNVQTQCNNYPVQKQVGEVVTVQYKGRLYSFEARY